MGAQGFDAGVGVLSQVDPVVMGHAAPAKRIADLFDTHAGNND
jgi:hypothetical protein